jgi:hypothetical protein
VRHVDRSGDRPTGLCSSPALRSGY